MITARSRCCRALAALLLCMTVAVNAETVIEQLDVEQQRTFGYQIGDTFVRTVHFRLRDPYVRLETSLPKAGRWSDGLTLGPDRKSVV